MVYRFDDTTVSKRASGTGGR